MSKETYYMSKEDSLFESVTGNFGGFNEGKPVLPTICQKETYYMSKRDLLYAKIDLLHVKRDLRCVKRDPLYVKDSLFESVTGHFGGLHEGKPLWLVQILKSQLVTQLTV